MAVKVTIPETKGYYLFGLEDVLKDRGISANHLREQVHTDFKVIDRILKGTIMKADNYVVARICDFLECDSDEIIKYVSSKK